MKKLLREPLLHFLLLGAGLFGAYAVLNRNQPAAQNEILVSAGQIETLAATFAKIWQRPPSEQELKAQIDAYVKEEMLSREAIALGLDKNDTVIRRRLQQKMEFLAEDFAAASDPTEAELADYLAKHPDQFAEEPRFTFRQVFLSPDKRGDRLEADATQLLADLKKQGTETDIAELGDSSLLPQDLADASQRSVVSQFGSEFTPRAREAQAGRMERAYPIRIRCASGFRFAADRGPGAGVGRSARAGEAGIVERAASGGKPQIPGSVAHQVSGGD